MRGDWWYDLGMVIDVIKQAIRESGLSFKRLAQETGVNRQVLARFLSGETPSINSESIEKLAVYFNLELKPARRGGGRKGRE